MFVTTPAPALIESLRAGFPDTFVLLDPTGLILEVLPGDHFAGFFADLRPGQLLTETLSRRSRNEIQSVLARYRKQEVTCEVALPAVVATENEPPERFFEFRFIPGRNDGIMLLIRDVSEKKLFESRIQESRERLTDILQSLDDAVWSTDLRTNQILYLSPVSERLYGRTFTEFLDNPNLWFDAVHPDDASRVQGWMQELAIGGHLDWEFRILRPDGELRWMRVRLWLSQDEEGNPQRIDGIASDLTEKKKIEQELEDARHQELETASRIQKTLLIGSPPKNLKRAEVAAMTLPSLGVDGDFYDFFMQWDECFDLVIGDVMGKGVPAALIGAACKAGFYRALSRLLASGSTGSFPEAIDIVNTVHRDITPQLLELGSYLTMIYCRFDLKERKLSYVDCGHPQPVHYKARTGTWEFLEPTAIPIGLFPDKVCEGATVTFEPGDSFLFYSDGFTDVRNDENEFFGEERLAMALRDARDLPAAEGLTFVHQRLLDFAPPEKYCDDLTCILVKTRSES